MKISGVRMVSTPLNTCKFPCVNLEQGHDCTFRSVPNQTVAISPFSGPVGGGGCALVAGT
jgi:hypothetical protein